MSVCCVQLSVVDSVNHRVVYLSLRACTVCVYMCYSMYILYTCGMKRSSSICVCGLTTCSYSASHVYSNSP